MVWNGYPAGGKGGSANVASYARLANCQFIHINTRLHIVKQYGSLLDNVRRTGISAKREVAIEKQAVYQGSVLTVIHYHLQMPGGKVIERDIVERHESVMVLSIGQKNNVILIEKYDLGAGVWRLTVPGGKVDNTIPEGIC